MNFCRFAWCPAAIALLCQPVFAADPEIITIAKADDTHVRNSEGSMVELKDGKLLLTWIEFTKGEGDSDFFPARIVAKTSPDGGRTWTDYRVVAVPEPGEISAFSPNLLRLADGRILFVYMRYLSFALAENKYPPSTTVAMISSDEGKTFDKLTTIIDTQPITVCSHSLKQLASGRIILPLNRDQSKKGTPDHFEAGVAYSDDGGKSWKQSQNWVDAPKRGAMEPHIEEIKNNQLLMVMRTQMGSVYQSTSTDGGETWSPGTSLGIEAPESCPELYKVPTTGDLMLIWNASKYDPKWASHFGKRTPLSSAISKDGGRTWSPPRHIETDPTWAFSNPGAYFTSKETLVLNYWACKYTDKGYMSNFPIDLKGAIVPIDWLYDAPKFRLATFSADVTPPAGHPLLAGASRCPGAVKIDDPLSAVGFVLEGGEKPVVVCSIDWCEIRNDAYDRWRDALAEAAGTTRDRVLVTSIHQHDAPLPDLTAQRILEEHGAKSKVIDPEFHEQCVQRTAQALAEGLKKAQPVTHLGLGIGKVEKVASNRRFKMKNGTVSFERSSMSGGKADQAEADEGEIDPYLRTISFWNGERAVCALHAYSVHPMSNWGDGNVTCDFPGLARRRRQTDDPAVHQIYASGASGDVTAGKYNDGNLANRAVLTDRVYRGMVAAWEATKRVPLEKLEFRSVPMLFTPRDTPNFTIPEMTAALKHELPNRQSLAALGLSARKRFDAKQPVDLPVLDFGPAQIVLLPGESYVHFQLLAQKLRPDSFVMTMGYGESAPGYVAPDRAWDDNDGNLALWCWNQPKTGDAVLTEALKKGLRVK